MWESIEGSGWWFDLRRPPVALDRRRGAARGEAGWDERGGARVLLRERGLLRVSAECDARNVASVRLLERTGFTRERHRIANTWIKGEWTDDLLYGLLAGDWRG